MLTIDPEFKNLIPPLTPEERAGLEASIAREGCRDPLVVWTDTGILLDGHHRHEICGRLGRPYNTVGMRFPDRDGAREWVIRNQFARRNLTPWQRAELAMKLEDTLRPAARERMLAGKADPSQNSDQGRVIDGIARAAGLSADTINKAKTIREKASPAVHEALRSGQTSINAEYLRLRNPVNRLSSDSMEWYTPAIYVEAARRVLGAIDLDPASCEKANETIRAARYYNQEDDGLVQEWPGRIWLNPPYCGLQGPFVQKLVREYRAGRTQAAVILVNANSTDTEWFAPLFDFPICFVRGRANFYSPSTEKSSPTHGSAVGYLGPDEDRFIEVFQEFGPVVLNAKWARRVDAPAAVAVSGR